MKIIIIAVVLILIIGVSVISIQFLSTETPVPTNGIKPKPITQEPKYPISLSLSASEASENSIIDVRLTISANKDVKDISIVTLLPDNVEVINGNLSWNGNLSSNQSKDIQAEVKVTRQGNFTILTIASNSTSFAITQPDSITIEGTNITEPNGGQMNGSGGPGIPVTPNYPPAPQWIVERGKEIIISYVGEEYFNTHILLKSSRTNERIGSRGDLYTLEYIYITPLKSTSDGPLVLNKEMFLLWLDHSGKSVDYFWIQSTPKKPYKFLVSMSEAMDIAKENGMPDPKPPIIEYGPKFGIEESYVLYVLNEDEFLFNTPIVVYTDVDTGTVLGVYIEKTSNTTLNKSDIFD